MKTITIHIQNERDAELLKKILETTKFEDKVESYEEYEELSEQDVQMLEERWEEYTKQPGSATSLDDFKKELKDKHGL